MKKFPFLVALAFLVPLALHAAPDSPADVSAKALATAEASAKAGKEKLKKELAAMADAFCAMAAEKGLLAAFSHFAAPEDFAAPNPN